MTEEEYYARIKAEYEASTDEKLVEWARPYFEGTKKPDDRDVYIVCPVTDRAAEEIERITGSCVRGFNHAIASSEIKHIRKRHGIFGIADKSMRDINDLGRMAYILDKFDTIDLMEKRSQKFRDKTGERAKVIRLSKRINGHAYVMEAVTDIERKRLMCIHSMFIKIKHKKGSQELDAHISAPELNVRNEVGSVTSILPQSEINVNSLEKKSFDPPDRQTERQRTADNVRAKITAEMAQIKAELRGKSPQEIAEMSRQARQKNKQNGNNANGNGGKPSSGNGSGGNSGR